MTWSRVLATRPITIVAALAFAPLASGCVIAVVDDMAEEGGTSDGDPSTSGSTTSTSASGGSTTSSSTNSGGGSGGGSSTTGDGDGDGDAGDGDGSPCGPYPTTEVPECPGIVGEGFCSEGGGHVDIGTAIEWMHEPPHSGPHFPVWSSFGEKLDPIERGYWVHNLEHGAIVLIHNCPQGNPQQCNDQLDILREVMAARPDHGILMTPDPLLQGSTFAAVSWTWVYAFDTATLEQLLCFVDQHYDHAPESVLPSP